MKRSLHLGLASVVALLLMALLLAACSGLPKLPGLPGRGATRATPPSAARGGLVPTQLAPTAAVSVTKASTIVTGTKPLTSTVPSVPVTPTVKTPVTGTAASAMTVTLEGTVWKLMSYLDSKGATTLALTTTEVTAEFRDGKVAGNDGCNQYTGTYKATGAALTIKQVASTMKACLPKIDQQSAAYSAALSSAATYTITARQLHLVNGAGKVALTFAVMDAGVVAPPAVAPTRVMTPTRVVTATAVPTTTVATTVTLPLEGTSWTLSGLADAKGVVTQPLTSTQVTAMFKAGRITGSAGCNNYSAAFRTTSTTLQINSAVALTRKACEPAISKQEAAYLNALGRSATYKITGAKLELRNAAGAVVASFTGTAPAAPAAMPAPAVRTPAPVVTATQAITMAVKPTATVTPIVAAAQPPASLANTTWKWARSITPAEALDVANSDKYSVVFKPDGTLSIVADCNRASGTYKINGSQMQIKLDATRQAACPAGSLSSQFLKNLQASVLYFMDNGALFIDLAADTGTMKFVNAGAAK